MTIAKGIKTDALWLENRQLQVMEENLRSKKEQVPEFASELKALTNHILVEYTRSHIWGSGNTTRPDLIANGHFRGLNHLGQLLMKIRDNFYLNYPAKLQLASPPYFSNCEIYDSLRLMRKILPRFDRQTGSLYRLRLLSPGNSITG